jgi:hypothetical protein
MGKSTLETRWNADSIWKRGHFRILSIANMIVATHGRVTDKIAHRSGFSQSLLQIVDSTADQTLDFEAAGVHDFHTSLVCFMRWSGVVVSTQMTESRALVATFRDLCGCPEMVPPSASYRSEVLCRHGN